MLSEVDVAFLEVFLFRAIVLALLQLSIVKVFCVVFEEGLFINLRAFQPAVMLAMQR